MANSWIDRHFKSLAPRVASDAGFTTLLSVTDPPVPDEYSEAKLGQIERSVIGHIEGLAQLTRFEFSTGKRWEKRWEPRYTLANSLMRLVYTSITNPFLTLVFVREFGVITEIKSFPNWNNITTDTRHGGRYYEFYDYANGNQKIVAAEQDVAQIPSFSTNYPQPRDIRRSEYLYNKAENNRDKIKGFLSTDREELEELVGGTKEELAAIKKIETTYANNNVTLITKEGKFMPVTTPKRSERDD